VVSPNTQTDGMTKVPKGCSEGFYHFWHLVTLGFPENYTTTHLIEERRLLKNEYQERMSC
jgi:hypothetical protein